MAAVKLVGDGPSNNNGTGFANASTASQQAASTANLEKSGDLNAGGFYDTAYQAGYGNMPVADAQQLSQSQGLADAEKAGGVLDTIANPESLWDKIGGGIALMGTVGALTAGAGAELGFGAGEGLGLLGSSGSLVGGTAGTVALGAASGAVGGTLGSTLTGQNVGKGALLGGLGGAVAGGIGAGLNGLGVNPVVSGLAGKAGSQLATQEVGSMFSNGSNSPTGVISGNNNMMPSTGSSPYSTGAVGAPGVMSNLGNLFSPGGAGLSTLSSLGAAAGGLVANSNQNSSQTNAYTTAGNAANSGNQWSATGAGGVGASFNNGQYTSTAGQFSPFTGGYANNGSAALNQAQMYNNGGVPSSVQQGYNAYTGQINQGIGTANQGVNSGQSLMNQGTSTLNSAGANYNSAYNTSLNAGLQALNPAIQQQSNALLNSNFERGQAGTSGGALQTQALQNSFNTADLQVQQNAVTQGLAAMNTTGSLGLGEYNAGTSATGNFNAQGVNFAGQGNTAAQGLAAFSPQMAGLYQNNANNAVAGATGVNNMGLATGQAAQGAVNNVGNQMNAGAKTQGAISTANTYNPGGLSYLGSLLGSGSGSGGGLLGGASSLIQQLFGGTGSSAFNSPTAQSFDTTSGGVNAGGIPTDISSGGGATYGTDLSSIYGNMFGAAPSDGAIPGYF